jgi:hypothetical protein
MSSEPVGNCGCRLERTEKGLKMVDCPLHSAALDLLKACDYIDAVAPLDDPKYRDDTLVTITITEKGLRDLRRAMAKAKGRG